MLNYLDTQGVSLLWENIKKIQKDNLVYKTRTKEQWDTELTLVSELNVFYIYSNYKKIEKDGQEIIIPGIKIGDGKTYLIDLPFLNGVSGFEETLTNHVDNNNIHVSQEDRSFWNNKINLSLQRQTLILNRN